MNFAQRSWLPWHFQCFFLKVKGTQPGVRAFVKFPEQTVSNTLLSMQTFQLMESLLGDLPQTLDFHIGH